MIPREILKKIRQIELRNDLRRMILFPLSPMLWVSTCVKDRQDNNALVFHQKVYHERKTTNDCAANVAAHLGEPFRIIEDLLEMVLNNNPKFLSQSYSLVFVIGNRIVKFLCRNATKDEAPFHLRYFTSSLERTSSSETTSFGLSWCSWSRWSMSSASPGSRVPSKSPNSNAILSTNSRRSASGIRRISSRISVLLMAAIYSFESAAQVGVSCAAPSRIGNRQLAIFP